MIELLKVIKNTETGNIYHVIASDAMFDLGIRMFVDTERKGFHIRLRLELHDTAPTVVSMEHLIRNNYSTVLTWSKYDKNYASTVLSCKVMSSNTNIKEAVIGYFNEGKDSKNLAKHILESLPMMTYVINDTFEFLSLLAEILVFDDQVLEQNKPVKVSLSPPDNVYTFPTAKNSPTIDKDL